MVQRGARDPRLARKFYIQAGGQIHEVEQEVTGWEVGLWLALGFVEMGQVPQLAMAQDNRPTALEVVAVIQQHIGVQWKTPTVDTFKAGNPDTPVTGIAVTMMATMDVSATRNDERPKSGYHSRADVLQPPGRAGRNGGERSGVESET